MPSGVPLKPDQIAEVLRRLDAGGTLAGVARELGLSRWAVRNCRTLRDEGTLPMSQAVAARGGVRLTQGRRPKGAEGLQLRPGEILLERPIRCPDCGGLITVLPCRLEAVRASKYGPRDPDAGFPEPRRKTA